MVTILAGLFVLTIVVIFHEFSHLLIAKWNGVKVIRFSVGFGPILFSKKIGETEYAVSLLPLGGYILPLSQEAVALFKAPPPKSLKEKLLVLVPPLKECQSLEPQEKYMELKPPWQRMAIAAAGPVPNYILALGIFIGLYFFS